MEMFDIEFLQSMSDQILLVVASAIILLVLLCAGFVTVNAAKNGKKVGPFVAAECLIFMFLLFFVQYMK